VSLSLRNPIAWGYVSNRKAGNFHRQSSAVPCQHRPQPYGVLLLAEFASGPIPTSRAAEITSGRSLRISWEVTTVTALGCR
jgi:hypothetical protein